MRKFLFAVVVVCSLVVSQSIRATTQTTPPKVAVNNSTPQIWFNMGAISTQTLRYTNSLFFIKHRAGQGEPSCLNTAGW
jgi:hypothetical protein